MDYLRHLHTYLTFFRGASQHPYQMQMIDLPPGRRILVLSPHFDDDILGCGGTLIKHVTAGCDVSIVYMTNGRGGDPSNPDKAEVERIRKAEAQKAAGIIGVKNLHYLDFPDGSLQCNEMSKTALKRILCDRRPDLVYLPWVLDYHIDHQATNLILAGINNTGPVDFNICAYEVHTPLPANCAVDITSQFETKKKAVCAHESQLKQCDYLRVASGLNAYRSLRRLQGQGYVEAFILLKAKEYLKIVAELKM